MFCSRGQQKLLAHPSEDTYKDIVRDFFGSKRYTGPIHTCKEVMRCDTSKRLKLMTFNILFTYNNNSLYITLLKKISSFFIQIYIPLNHGGIHWLCLHINMVKRQANIFDSKRCHKLHGDRELCAKLLVGDEDIITFIFFYWGKQLISYSFEQVDAMQKMLYLAYVKPQRDDLTTFPITWLDDIPCQGVEDW